MAKQCIYCGKILPGDDAQFCNNCGRRVAPALSERASLPPQTNLPPGRQEHAPQASPRRVLPEQIALQSPSHPGQSSSQDEPPAWLSRLESGMPRTSPSRKTGDHPSQPPRPDLHVKVWREQEPADLPPTQQEIAPAGTGEGESEDERVEDLPTAHLAAAGLPEQHSSAPELQRSAGEAPADSAEDFPTGPLAEPPDAVRIQPRPRSRPAFARNEQLAPPEDVELLETRPVPSQRQAQPMSHPMGGMFTEQQPQGAQTSPGPGPHPVVQRPLTPSLPFLSSQAAQAPKQTPPAVQPVAPGAPLKKRGGKRLAFILILLGLLALGGLGTWLIALQPFTVPEITKTEVPFQNADLGIALHYPQGWTAQVDQKHAAVYFYDANHTDQVNVATAPINGQDLQQYMKKEGTQLGLTAQKEEVPLSFAGASWQQVRGTVIQSGANYTTTLLVTQHGNRFYSIIQMAPSTTYNDADHLFFSLVRSTFRFL